MIKIKMAWTKTYLQVVMSSLVPIFAIKPLTRPLVLVVRLNGSISAGTYF